MFSDAKEHIRDKLRCRPTGAVASARPRGSAGIFPYALYFSLVHRPAEFLFTFRLLLFSRFLSFLFLFLFFYASLLFCFLGKAGVFVGSSVVVPPVFPFFSSCLPCPFVFCLFSFSPFFFFCIYYEFILAEDLCVHLPLLLISLSFSGGFLVKKVFPLF